MPAKQMYSINEIICICINFRKGDKTKQNKTPNHLIRQGSFCSCVCVHLRVNM